MSYAMSGPLQEAVYQALVTDAGVTAALGSAVFDKAPSGAIAGIYASLGEETVRDASDVTCAAAVHEFVISVVTDAPGFADAKAAAGTVCDALIGANLILSRGSLIGLDFVGARAQRTGKDARRRIDLRFRARVEDA